MKPGNVYRKINVFYADDLSENIRNLLEGLILAGLYIQPSIDTNQLKTIRSDSLDVCQHNKKLLTSDLCLINLNYSTRIDDSIDIISASEQNFDLVICDLYFGEGDRAYKESKIGGMWIILWAKQKAKSNKIICKLYSGQADLVRGHIDFRKAQEFLWREHEVKVDEVQKFQDKKSWREQLVTYLEQVSENIITEIKYDDRTEFINLLSQSFKREIFHNFQEAKNLEAFRQNLYKLEHHEFNLADGKKLKLIHLFPILIGKRFLVNDDENFKNLDDQNLENVLYTNDLEFTSKEEREIKITELKKLGIGFNQIKKHDIAGNPVYWLKITSGEYSEGIVAKLEKMFIHSLDNTYKIYNFYHQQKGFNIWSRSLAAFPLTGEEFDRIRNDIILPTFARIKDCFQAPDQELSSLPEPLEKQIEKALVSVNQSEFSEKRKFAEQQLEHGFEKLGKYPLLNTESMNTIIPLKSLFKINLGDFFKIVLGLQEGDTYSDYEDDEFQRSKSNDLYWYCNAYRIRKGLKEIRKNMPDEKVVFYLLESKDKENKALIKYKIILRDFGRGIPSIVRKFYLVDKQRFLFDQYLAGFCQLIIRSKMANFEGISFNVFTGKDDILCDKMKIPGTEFEIQFTQGR